MEDGCDPPQNATWAAGEEGSSGWKTIRSGGPDIVESKDGWAFGRIGATGNSFSLRLSRIKADATPSVQLPVFESSTLRLEGADADFVTSLRSQIFTLKQGIVGDETRPGDPLNYPLEWLRDGAYIVVALLRAGEIDTARRLGLAMASKRFFWRLRGRSGFPRARSLDAR